MVMYRDGMLNAVSEHAVFAMGDTFSILKTLLTILS